MVRKKLISLFLAVVLFTCSVCPAAGASGIAKSGTEYPFVFVSGFAGWGKYDKLYQNVKYWGGLKCDLMKYLNSKGFECGASSVDPVKSAWDRACELYAQLTGNVTDYGKVHSKIYGHERFGPDFCKSPLIEGWGMKDNNGKPCKVNFICHSFGGTTARLLAQLMANGSKAEIKGTEKGKVSGLFTGGKAGWINSITTLATPHNGTTITILADPAYALISGTNTLLSFTGMKNVDFSKTDYFGVYDYLRGLGKVSSEGIGKDTGVYDLSVDGAAELNKMLSPLKNVYYFSVPCDATASYLNKNQRIPNPLLSEPILWPTTYLMGNLTGRTAGGIAIDESWLNNDGVINTISSVAPKNEASKLFDAENIKPGIWNIMSTFRGDHASIVGGTLQVFNIRAYYLKQLKLIDSL
ncbi:MAG: hypothetical protein WCN92_02340 [Eubacteriales bacterium]